MIYIDTLEPKEFRELFPKNAFKLHRLERGGDFAICRNDQVLCVIERKTWKDLSSSMCSKNGNRLYDQLRRLKEYREETGCKLYVLVEGKQITTRWKFKKGLSGKAMLSKLDRLMFRDDIHVIHTASKKHTVDRLLNMDRTLNKYMDEQDMKATISKDDITSKDEASELACSDTEHTDDVSISVNAFTDESDDNVTNNNDNIVDTASLLLIEAGASDTNNHTHIDGLFKKASIDKFYILRNMWTCIPGVSPRTFKTLAAATSIRKFHEICKMPSASPHISKIFTDANVNVKPTFINRMIKGMKSNATQAKIISRIPGITTKTANSLIKEYTFSALNIDTLKHHKWVRTPRSTMYLIGCLDCIHNFDND